MLGNVWEWTSTTFQPYPGFAPDAYTEYSTMLFGNTKVLRGGAWTTRSRMIMALTAIFSPRTAGMSSAGFGSAKQADARCYGPANHVNAP